MHIPASSNYHIQLEYKYFKSNKHDRFYLLENFGRILQNIANIVQFNILIKSYFCEY